jgi:hypothetical protein
MRFLRRHLLAVAATMAVFSVAAPVSSASALAWPGSFPSGFSGAFPGILPGGNSVGGQTGSYGCGTNAPSGNGPAGGTANQVCGATLAFVGPSIGQIASVVGPTIIGPTVIGSVTVSAGPVGR